MIQGVVSNNHYGGNTEIKANWEGE